MRATKENPTILVLPGIGDVYWVMTGLRAWMRKHGITGTPTVHVWDFDSRRRSLEYVERIPFVKAGGYFDNPPHPFKAQEFKDTYQTGARSVVENFRGFDYYVAVNGALVTGRTIDEALGVSPADLDWFPMLERTPADIDAELGFGVDFGAYCVLHFSRFGMFSKWVKAWDVESCAAFIRRAETLTGLRMLLTGSSWDRPLCEELAAKTGAVNLCGETSPDAFFGMLHGASGVAGWCGGNTILATALRVPTLMLWSDTQFKDPRFFANACPPASRGTWYRWGTVESLTPVAAAEMFADAIECGPVEC